MPKGFAKLNTYTVPQHTWDKKESQKKEKSESNTTVTKYKQIPLDRVPKFVLNYWELWQKGELQNTPNKGACKSYLVKYGFLPHKTQTPLTEKTRRKRESIAKSARKYREREKQKIEEFASKNQ